MKKEIGIYVHLPFCEQKCNYCDFCSFSGLEQYQQQYVKKLVEEINFWSQTEKNNVIIKTIYIGGGTPSTVFDGAINTILQTIYQAFNCSECDEITIECNPNSITQKKLEEYKRSGVNRISLGIQSLDDNVLNSIGRLHNAIQGINAIKLIKQNGFINFSVDLMSGLPNQSLEIFKNTLLAIVGLEPTHISCYSLILEKNTKLEKMVIDKKITLPSEEDALQMFYLASKVLEQNGYKQYEVSNFCKPSFESKHNLNYWQCGEYLGFGLNASSYYNGLRFTKTKDFKAYLELNNFSANDCEICETIDKNTQKTELIMLGLRMTTGLNLTKYSNLTGENLLDSKQKTITNLQKSGMIQIENNHLFVPTNKMSLLNLIIMELI